MEETAYKIDVEEMPSDNSSIAKKEEVIEPVSALLVSASMENGEKLFKKCATCHNYEKGGANKVGPQLWNIINRPKANVEGYAYSKALAEYGGEWGYEELAEFLYKPKISTKIIIKGKKWMKCVKNPDGKGYKKIHWGQKGVKVSGKANTKRRKSFRARHKCSSAKPGTARYQACKDW